MRNDSFDYIALNIPHSSAAMCDVIPYDDGCRLAEDVQRWTDWHTDVLFRPSPNLSPWVIPYVFPYSRFFIDAERLENDELEDIGEGVVYTNFKGNRRHVASCNHKNLMTIYRNHLSSIFLNERTLLIDCHSFPSDLAADVDKCIGFNENDSKPSNEQLQCIADTFVEAGYRTSFNAPYSNALTPPHPIHYKSVIIEVNKAIYMDEQTADGYIHRRFATPLRKNSLLRPVWFGKPRMMHRKMPIRISTNADRLHTFVITLQPL